MMHGNGMMEGMPMMGPLMWVFMLLLWGFAIFGLICAIRWFLSRGKEKDKGGSQETALDVLKKRFARGEIALEEFERAKKDLE
jgi:putative membrane protein